MCICMMGYMHMQKAVRSTLIVLGKVPCGMFVVS
jgi:hypothetical protein